VDFDAPEKSPKTTHTYGSICWWGSIPAALWRKIN